MDFTNVTKLVTEKSVSLLQSSLSGGRTLRKPTNRHMAGCRALTSPSCPPLQCSALSALRRLPRPGLNETARRVLSQSICTWRLAEMDWSRLHYRLPLCDLSEAPDRFLRPFQAYAHKRDPARDHSWRGLKSRTSSSNAGW